MNETSLAALLACISLMFSCDRQETAFDKDLAFLKKYDSVIVLSSEIQK